MLEQDDFYFNKLAIDKTEECVKTLNKIGSLETVIKSRYDFINNICKNSITYTKSKTYGYSKLDKFVLNKWLSIPIFLAIVAFIFFLTFGNFGTKLSQWLSDFFSNILFIPLQNFLVKNTSNVFVINFLTEAVVGSFLSLISFLPQIVLMFLGLFILEDSGYMSRLAFVVEDFLKKIGLSGKSIFTLLMGFGCSTTASMTSRNLEDKNSKIKTAMLAPYISCSAKLPLYAIVCNAFFPKAKFVVIILLYLLGVVVALLVSYFLNKTILKSGQQSFIMELPPYRFPSIKRIVRNIFINIKQFLLRVGSILLGFSCLIWIIQNCNFKLQYGVGDSILEVVSKFLAPIFKPLGFGNYGAVACLLCGFVAKEIIVSTISLINGCGTSGIDEISKSLLLSSSVFSLTLPSSISFLVFSLLYLPCVSTVGVLNKEIGTKWTLFACCLEFIISYLLAFVAYKIAIYFCYFGLVSGILSTLTFLIVFFVLFKVKAIIKKRGKCKYCLDKKCKHN